MKTIEVLKDTLIVEDNTADSLAVLIHDENPVFEYTSPDGAVVKGENLSVVTTSHVTQGALVQRLAELEAQSAEISTQIVELTTLINNSIKPAVNNAIGEILATPGSQDRRGGRGAALQGK